MVFECWTKTDGNCCKRPRKWTAWKHNLTNWQTHSFLFQDFRDVASGCVEKVQAAFREMDSLSKTKQGKIILRITFTVSQNITHWHMMFLLKNIANSLKNDLCPLSGLKQISSAFKLCEALNSTVDYNRQLVGWIRNSFTNLAMFDYPYPTRVFSTLPANPVKVCTSPHTQ